MTSVYVYLLSTLAFALGGVITSWWLQTDRALIYGISMTGVFSTLAVGVIHGYLLDRRQ